MTDPYSFAGWNIPAVAVLETLVWRVAKGEWLSLSGSLLFFYGITTAFCGLIYVFLTIIVKVPKRPGFRPNFERLLRAFVYVLSGPQLLYSWCTLTGGVGVFWTGTRFHLHPVIIIIPVLVFALVTLAFAIYYPVRVVRLLYQVKFPIAVIACVLFYVISSSSATLYFRTISLDTLTESERKILKEVIAGSMAERDYRRFAGECGDWDGVKEYSSWAWMNSVLPMDRMLALMRVGSEGFQKEMYGYRLRFKRNERVCSVEATPVDYSSETRLSFYTEAVLPPLLVFADNHKGGYASPQDKFVLIWQNPLVPNTDD